MGDPDQHQVKDTHTLFMGMVSEDVQADPLNGMENHQNNSKKNEI